MTYPRSFDKTLAELVLVASWPKSAFILDCKRTCSPPTKAGFVGGDQQPNVSSGGVSSFGDITNLGKLKRHHKMA